MKKVYFDSENYITFSDKNNTVTIAFNYKSPYYKYLSELRDYVKNGLILFRMNEEQLLKCSFWEDYRYIGFWVEEN